MMNKEDGKKALITVVNSNGHKIYKINIKRWRGIAVQSTVYSLPHMDWLSLNTCYLHHVWDFLFTVQRLVGLYHLV